MKPLLLLLLLALSVSLAMYAQPTAILHGVVTDESGAVIPGAKVTVSSASGPVKSVVSGDNGDYSIAGLAPGKYTVSAASPGLQQTQPAAIDISGASATANLLLKVAAEKQEVTVQENAGPAVSVDPSQNAGALVLRGADLQALSDDPDDLQADLQALAGPSAGPSGGQIYIDGFTGGTLPSKDSIREIRINQNPFSPEFDKLGYGRIEILTKPGTDKLHGNIFTEFGDDIFNSRNPYAAQKAPFLQRNFGGSISGALGKKASFFVDVQDREIHNGNVINGFNVDPNTFGVAPFNSVFEAPQNRFRISPRIDYQLSQNNTLTFRYGFTRNDLQDQGVGNLSLLSRAYSSLDTDQTVQIVETAILSTKVINETRFQWYHENTGELASSLLPGVTVAGAFNGGGAQVGHSIDTENHFEFQNYTTDFGRRTYLEIRRSAASRHYRQYFAPKLRRQLHVQWRLMSRSWTRTACRWTRASNAIRPIPMLPDCQQLTSIQVYQRTLLLQHMGLNAAQIQQLGGGPSQFTIAQGNPLANVNQVDAGLFVGDDWRLKPNLTLSLGLR